MSVIRINKDGMIANRVVGCRPKEQTIAML